MLADFEDWNDSRMIQLCGSFGFGLKTSHICFGRQSSAENHLQGDSAIQSCLASAENDTHATPRDLFQHFVVPEIANFCSRCWARVRFAVSRFGGNSIERISIVPPVGENGFVPGL